MKNDRVTLAVNVTLWVIIAVAGGYAASGFWRWYMIGIGVAGLAFQLFAFRRSAPAAHCSFCGRPPAEGRTLVHGPNVRICSSCVALAQQVVTRGDSAGRSILE